MFLICFAFHSFFLSSIASGVLFSSSAFAFWIASSSSRSFFIFFPKSPHFVCIAFEKVELCRISSASSFLLLLQFSFFAPLKIYFATNAIACRRLLFTYPPFCEVAFLFFSFIPQFRSR